MQDSKKDCEDVMRVFLKEWLAKKFEKLGGAPRSLSREEDIKFFWEWVREFHNEYNEDWFSRNMPRLKTEFTPVWKEAVRSLPGGAAISCSPPAAEPIRVFFMNKKSRCKCCS